MIDAGVAVALGALWAFAATWAIRSLSPLAWLVRKPVGCDLCMSVWTGLAGSLVAWSFMEVVWAWLLLGTPATVGLCLLLLTLATQPGPPPSLPALDLDDSAETPLNLRRTS